MQRMTNAAWTANAIHAALPLRSIPPISKSMLLTRFEKGLKGLCIDADGEMHIRHKGIDLNGHPDDFTPLIDYRTATITRHYHGIIEGEVFRAHCAIVVFRSHTI